VPLFACPKKPPITEPEETVPQFMPFSGADINAGKATYETRCARCHGDTGKGDGPAGLGFDVAPTNFTSWQPPADEDLFLWIRDGGSARGRSQLMPDFGRSLSAQELRDVAAYIKTFNK
jgi:high-affinity iron transporter